MKYIFCLMKIYAFAVLTNIVTIVYFPTAVPI